MSWLKIVPSIFSGISEYFARKHELRMKKIEVQGRVLEAEAEATIRLRESQQTHVQNWELASIQNSSWKDDYLTIFTTGIVLACFIPHTQGYVGIGFDILTDKTPIWFQVMVAIVYSSAFGVRVFDHYKKLVTTPRIT